MIWWMKSFHWNVYVVRATTACFAQCFFCSKVSYWVRLIYAKQVSIGRPGRMPDRERPSPENPVVFGSLARQEKLGRARATNSSIQAYSEIREHSGCCDVYRKVSPKSLFQSQKPYIQSIGCKQAIVFVYDVSLALWYISILLEKFRCH